MHSPHSAGTLASATCADMLAECSRTSRMKLFVKLVDGFQMLTISGKSSILDVRLGSEYALKKN